MLTDFLKLFKADPTDGDNTFNITTMLNDNWDKLNAWAKGVTADIASVLPLKTTAIQRTTAPITYYVRPDGNDANDGSTNDATHAFKTIQFAINKLPKYLAHDVTINVAAGTYGEAVEVKGFCGLGKLTLFAANSITDNFNLTNVIISNCTCQIVTSGFKALTNGTGFSIANSINAEVKYCKSVLTGTCGTLFTNSIGTVSNCEFSNKSGAIWNRNSKLSSANNIGATNENGLIVETGGQTSKSGTQPSGTTAEFITSGGFITGEELTVTITSGFESGWSGTVTLRKSFDNWVELNTRLTKSTDINTYGETVLTIPEGFRPIAEDTHLSLSINSGGGLVVGGFLAATVNTNGKFDVANASNIVGARGIHNFKSTYYSA